MPDTPFKYDVAFSFLSSDEALATQLTDLLADRMSVFLYSERQAEIAGTDGEQTFNRVFGSEARIVVVLYRSGWGASGFTLIEQTAIRNRAYRSGYGFVVFIPLDEDPTVPEWLPKPSLWVGLERWGVNAAAAVIEERVRDAGGDVRAETVLDRAARIAKKRRFESERAAFRGSSAGVESAKSSAEQLFAELEAQMTAIGDRHPEFSFRVTVVRGIFRGYSARHTLQVLWEVSFSNSLDASGLTIDYWRGALGPNWSGEKRKLQSNEYQFDVAEDGRHGWREEDDEERFRTSGQLAEHALRTFFDLIDSPDDGPTISFLNWTSE
jgi:hypothetical protein